MNEHDVLVALRLAIVAVGALVTYWGLRLARRAPDHRQTYLMLSVGFALVTLAAVVEGVLFEFEGWKLEDVHTLEAFVSAGGFALILGAILKSGV